MFGILLVGLVSCGFVLGICLIAEAFDAWEDFFG